MMGYYGGFGLLGGLGMGVEMILSVALVALIIWAVVRLFAGQNRQLGESPLDALKRRYAKGEIGEAEFERAKQLPS